MTDPLKIDFWARVDGETTTKVAHAYQNGKALCGEPLPPHPTHFSDPGNIACKPCWKAFMARTGVICQRCLGKGRHCVRKYPGRRYAPCKECHGIGYLPKDVQDAQPIIPPPPPAVRRKTPTLPPLP